MFRQLALTLRVGIATEPPRSFPTLPALPLEDVGPRLSAQIQRIFGRSLHIRQVDAGSCNGCELEIGGLAGPQTADEVRGGVGQHGGGGDGSAAGQRTRH
jgi:hypothetical protein